MPFALTVPPADDTDGRSSAVNRESMPRISIGDCSLYYERHGIGFPILFVSGLGGVGTFWVDQQEASAQRLVVAPVDLGPIGRVRPARVGGRLRRLPVPACSSTAA